MPLPVPLETAHQMPNYPGFSACPFSAAAASSSLESPLGALGSRGPLLASLTSTHQATATHTFYSEQAPGSLTTLLIHEFTD